MISTFLGHVGEMPHMALLPEYLKYFLYILISCELKNCELTDCDTIGYEQIGCELIICN
jgi:hypothetical protein